METFFVQPGFFMTAVYLGALAAIAVSLSVLMAGAWLVQQRTGNSGWVDTIWTFFPRPGGRRSCAVAGRRNFPQRAAMAGRGAAGDLVAAVGNAHCDSHCTNNR